MIVSINYKLGKLDKFLRTLGYTHNVDNGYGPSHSPSVGLPNCVGGFRLDTECFKILGYSTRPYSPAESFCSQLGIKLYINIEGELDFPEPKPWDMIAFNTGRINIGRNIWKLATSLGYTGFPPIAANVRLDVARKRVHSLYASYYVGLFDIQKLFLVT